MRNTRLPSRKKAKFTDRRAQAVHTLNNTDTENSDPSTEERAKKKPGMGAWIKSTYSRVRGRFSHPPSPPVDPFKARAPMTAPKNNPYKNGKAIALFEVSQKPKGAEFIYRPTIYAVGDHTGVDLPTEASKHEQVIRPTTPTPLDNHWMPLFEHNTKVMSSLKATQDGKILEAGQDYEITQNREGLVMIRSTGTPLNEVKLEMGYSKRESPPTNHQLENLDPIVLRSITDDLMRSGLTVIAKQINSAIDQSSKTQRSFGLSELEKIIRDSSRYSFDSNRNADFSLSEQGPYAHLQPFLDSHGNLHMQCNGAAVLQSQLLNSYFERANLPFSAEFTRVFNIRSGIVTDQNLHAVVAIRQGKDGPVITYLDSTATVFGRFRDFLHRLKTRAKRTMLGVDYPEKMARSSSNFHGTLTESQDQESLMKKMEIAITPLRRIFREQESLRSYRPLQDPIRIISNSGNMNPHLAAMRAYRFINFLLDQNSQYSAPLSDMDQRHHQGETSPIETLPTRGTDNIGVLGEIDAHIEVLTSQLESHLNLIEIQSKKKKLPLGYSVYLRPEVSSHILDQLRTAIATLQEIRARPHLIHERAYTEFVPATDPFLDSNNHPEKYMPSHERKQFARLNSAQPGPGYCKKQKQTSSRD